MVERGAHGFSLPSLRETVEEHGLLARKGLGQHFLFDLNLTARIARAAGIDENDPCPVIEIGPGPGGLTRALLLAGARHVIAVERDRRCIAILRELQAVSGGRLHIVEGDALAVDERKLLTQYGLTGPVRIAANLPYNIGTELLFKWLEDISYISSMTLMFQKEVAGRITAKPRTKSYGKLSVIAQSICEVRHEFDIHPQAFFPPPEVTSSVVTLIPRPERPSRKELRLLHEVCNITFQQRRKMLRTSLGATTNLAGAILSASGIDPARRPEELTIAEFHALARAFGDLKPETRSQN